MFIKVTKWIKFHKLSAYKTARFSLLALLLPGNEKRLLKKGHSVKELWRTIILANLVYYLLEGMTSLTFKPQ